MIRCVLGFLLLTSSAYAGPFIAPNVSADGKTIGYATVAEITAGTCH